MNSASSSAAPSPAPVAAPASKLMSKLSTILRSSSFKEDSYVASALPSSELRALADLKALLATHPDPISIWGVPLNPDSPSPAVLNDLLDDDLGLKDLEGVVAYMHGWDREGHPVCYNAHGVFKDRDMYDRVFGDGDRLARFLRWRIQVMEHGIRALTLTPGGVNSILQVTDLKNCPKWRLTEVWRKLLPVFYDNYPELAARKVFINVPTEAIAELPLR